MKAIYISTFFFLFSISLFSQPVSLTSTNPNYFLYNGKQILPVPSEEQYAAEINPDFIDKVWKANWIKHSNTNEHYGVYHFRKQFGLNALPSRFIIHISADNRYWLFVNGKRVCTGPAKGDVAHWRFESLDIAEYLNTGINVLAVTVWNQGDYKAVSQETYSTGLVIQGNSETETIVNTDESWKVIEDDAYSPVFDDFRFIGAREYFFAAKYPLRWEQLNADEGNFSSAVISEEAIPVGVAGKSLRRMVQRSIPLTEEIPQRFACIRKMENYPFTENFIHGKGDLEIYPWGKVTILLDQQHLTSAYPELLLSGGKGAKITITYMEAPFINVNNEDKGNRNEVEGKIRYGISDMIYPNGDSAFLYRPLNYRTFRYVELKIENYLQPLTIHDFSSRFTAYPFQENARFESSDSSLKTIWETGWRTARLCAFDTYMDCPYYEQLQYIGDTRIQALVSLYVSGDDRLMKNAISQFYDSRITDGLTQSRYPSTMKQVIPPFSLFWIAMIHDHWMHKQDPEFVKQYLQAVKEVLAWHKDKIDSKTGMLGKMPYWNFVDWPKQWPWLGSDEISGVPKGSADGNSSILTLQYVYAIDKAIELFDAFGMKTEAKEYLEIANSLKRNTYTLCWDNHKKMLADLPDKSEYSQHANVLAVLAGLPTGIDAKDLMNRTVADTSIVQCTVYYRFYLNQAMKKAGLGDRYIEMLTPWRDMVSMGLTTFAEKPEPSRSDCHGWSASPNYDLLATVLGVTPGSPGFRTVVIDPHLGSLTFANGKIPHPQGTIEVNIKKTGTSGMEAIVILPDKVSGVFIWKGEKIKLSAGRQIVNR